MATEVTKEQLVAQVKLRVEAARVGLADFGEFVFGLPCMEHHRGWCEALEDEGIKNLIILAPPEWAKSTWGALIYLTQKAARHPERHFAYLSYQAEVAEERMDAVRQTFETREFKFVYPNVVGDKKRTWGKGSWTLNRENKSDLDPTMKVAGFFAGVLSYHFDEIVVDDPHDPEIVISKTGRENTWRRWRGTVMTRLKRGGRAVILGYRWAEDDLVGRLMEAEPWHTAQECDRSCERDAWHVILTPALVCDEHESCSLETEGCRVRSTWPEQWPLDELLVKKQKTGMFWAAQFMGKPRPDEGYIFQWWPRYDAAPSFEQIVVGFDVAVEAGQEHDWNAWAAFGVRQKRAYFLDAGRIKTQGGDAERHIGMFAEKLRNQYRRPTVLVHAKRVKEDKIIGQYLRKRSLPVVGTPMGKLLTTAQMIAPYMEGGGVLWPEIMPDWFIEEMRSYNFAAHDDGVAAAMAALNYVFLRARAPRVRRPIYLWGTAA